MEFKSRIFRLAVPRCFFLVVSFGVFFSVLFSVGGCSSKTEDFSPRSPVLRIQLSSDPVSTDPSLAEDGASLKILANIQEGLTGYTGSGKLELRLASSYEVSEDGRVYTFKLRPDARWSDQVPIVARDFVTGIQRSLNPKTGCKLSELLSPIENVEALDKSTLKITLRDSCGSLLDRLALPVAAPQRQDILDLNGGSWPQGDHVGRGGALPPSSGPFHLTLREPGKRWVLEPNETDAKTPPPWKQVELLIVQDESTALSLFEKGRFDILTRIPNFDFQRMKAQGKVRTDPFFATYYLSFNLKLAPFNDVKWRKAVARAIDRDAIVQVLGSGETPARTWIPEALVDGNPETKGQAQAHDGSGAAPQPSLPLLAPAELKKFGTVEAGFDTSGRNSQIMERVQRDLGEALGLKVELRNQDWKSYVGQLRKAPPQIFRFGWLAPFRDPISHLQVFVSGNPNNLAKFSSVRYDRLVKEIERKPPGPERTRLVEEAQRILLEEEAVVVPLYHYVQNHAVAPRISNFKVNPFGVIRFSELKRVE